MSVGRKIDEPGPVEIKIAVGACLIRTRYIGGIIENGKGITAATRDTLRWPLGIVGVICGSCLKITLLWPLKKLTAANGFFCAQ